MSFGLEVFNSEGKLTYSTRGKTAHYLGQYTPTTASGSYTPPHTALVENLWANYVTTSTGSIRDTLWVGVWVEGKTIHWQTYSRWDGRGSFVIHFGGYTT